MTGSVPGLCQAILEPKAEGKISNMDPVFIENADIYLIMTFLGIVLDFLKYYITMLSFCPGLAQHARGSCSELGDRTNTESKWGLFKCCSVPAWQWFRIPAAGALTVSHPVSVLHAYGVASLPDKQLHAKGILFLVELHNLPVHWGIRFPVAFLKHL